MSDWGLKLIPQDLVKLKFIKFANFFVIFHFESFKDIEKF